ncbi:MAG: peptidase S9, partial [Bacteroidales bacterium]|nr:peptidase S9 [Bacteroidales bacterium]
MKFPILMTACIGLMIGCSQAPQIADVSELPAPLTEQETANKKLTPELLWKFGRIGEYKVSPDNTTVVYTVSRYSVSKNKGRTTVWTVPVKGGEPVCLTADVPQSAFNPRWNFSSGRIAYLTAVSGDVQIWDMKPDGTDKRQVSFIDGGINGFELSLDGKKLIFLKDVPSGESPNALYPDLPNSHAV